MYKKLFLCFILIYTSPDLLAQEALGLKGELKELLSNRQKNLKGALSNPKISPFKNYLFSFEHLSKKNHSLYIYNISNKRLKKISITNIFRDDIFNFQVDRPQKSILSEYNAQLDWRPLSEYDKPQWFAFVSNMIENNRDIYIGCLNNSNYFRLTTDNAVDEHPKWSPDGKTLAFLSNRNGYTDIYLIHNVHKVIRKGKPQELKITRLTDTPGKEKNLAWNPDPQSHLIAFSAQQAFPGRKELTFQIRIMDLKAKKFNIFEVTNTPLSNYTQPLWDPHQADRLLYIGKEIMTESTANVYLTELKWNEHQKLQNKNLKGYKTNIFKNIAKTNTPILWLNGGQIILCQQNSSVDNFLIYSININKWLATQENAVGYFEHLNTRISSNTEFDIWNNKLVLITHKGKIDKIFWGILQGDAITPNHTSKYQLTNPSESRIGKYHLLTAGIIATGSIAYFLYKNKIK